MTIRTVSLLLLFVVSLAMTGLLLALTATALDDTAVSGPWVAPVLALAVYTAVFFAGRGYILPPRLAARPAIAAPWLFVVVSLTLATALAIVWFVQWRLGTDLPGPNATIVLWFVLLWLAVARARRSEPQIPC